MVMISLISGEYDAAATTMSQVSNELQSAKIDDLSEAVSEAMKGADSISKAVEVESRYTSLLQTHSTALAELASAAKAAGVTLQLGEADKTAVVNKQGEAALPTGPSPSTLARAAALNGGPRGPLRPEFLTPTLPNASGAQPEMPVYRPGQGMPPYAPASSDSTGGQGPLPHPSPSPMPVAP